MVIGLKDRREGGDGSGVGGDNGNRFSFLDFVIKDTTSNQWYNHLESESNFRVPLSFSPQALDELSQSQRESETITDGQRSMMEKTKSKNKNNTKKKKKKRFLQLWEIPELPADLCGIWAYIKWEFSGCPERSEKDADQEYRQGIQEMNTLWRSFSSATSATGLPRSTFLF